MLSEVDGNCYIELQQDSEPWLRTLLLLEITSPFSDEECDGGDECDDADEGSEVAGGGRLVEDADLLALVVVVVPPVRRYRAEHEDGEHLQIGFPIFTAITAVTSKISLLVIASKKLCY